MAVDLSKMAAIRLGLSHVMLGPIIVAAILERSTATIPSM